MASAIATKWLPLDRVIQAMRFSRVDRHIPEGKVVIDLGCGTGKFLRHIEDRISLGLGVDPNIEDDISGYKFECVQANPAVRIPTDDSSADIVVAMALLEHLEDPERLISEVHRVLKPGGKFILTTPAPRSKPVLEFLAFKAGVISKADISDHKKYYSRSDLGEMLSVFKDMKYSTFQLGLNQLCIAVK